MDKTELETETEPKVISEIVRAARANGASFVAVRVTEAVIGFCKLTDAERSYQVKHERNNSH